MGAVRDGSMLVLRCHLVLSLWLHCGAAVAAGSSQEMVAVQLQTGEYADSQAYITNGAAVMPNMTQASLCIRVRLLSCADQTALFTYSVGDAVDELALYLTWRTGDLQIFCCNYYVDRRVKVPLELFTWHHLCVAIDLEANDLSVMFDETFSSTSAKDLDQNSLDESPSTIRGGGQFMLGQKTNPKAALKPYQTLRGDLADFIIYNRSLPRHVMEDYTRCYPRADNEAIISTFGNQMDGLRMSGDTRKYTTSLEDICWRHSGYQLLVPLWLPFREAEFVCKIRQGKLALPTNKEENTFIYDSFIRYKEICVNPNGAFYWLGLKSNLSDFQWSDLYSGSVVHWNNFNHKYRKPSREFSCAAVAGPNFPYEWHASPCDMGMCPVCNFSSPPSVAVRGLCKESKFNRLYFLYGYENGVPKYEGWKRGQIIWDNSTWVIKDHFRKKLKAVMIKDEQLSHPLGKRTWEVTGDICGSSQAVLLLSPCHEGEFTCANSLCISKHKRCDQAVDCPDSSDEVSCGVVRVPPGYSRHLPPVAPDASRLALGLAVGISSVREFSLVGFYIVLDITQAIKWRDSRLTFTGLKDDSDANLLSKETVWTPQVTLEDGSASPAETRMTTERLKVLRESEPLPDSDTRLFEDDVYSGDGNTLHLVQKYQVKVMCQFQLYMYPFDVQYCSFFLKTYGLKDKVDFIKDGIAMKGERKLLEYEATSVDMVIKEGKRSPVAQVTFKFTNQYTYYIGNAFVPSLLMTAICYVTFFFDLEDFGNRIAISLTSMLVLSALFSQSSLSIPKTSYFKLIDVWYDMLIFIGFLIIIVHVLIENLRCKQQPARVNALQVKEYQASEPRHTGGPRPRGAPASLASKVNAASLIVFPLLCTGFCITFFAVGAHSY